MEVDPRWLDVEAGRRYTLATAMQRYPQLGKRSFRVADLAFEMARKPKTSKQRAMDVKTYLPADVDALVARLAAPPEPEPVDPRWLEVEAGRRYTAATAMERHPKLTKNSFNDKTLTCEIARKPKTGNQRARDVKTYLPADVDALVARLATPEPVDPRWLEVEAGRRYTRTKALKRYPQMSTYSFLDLPFDIARRPKTAKAPYACDVKTYLAADIDALAAERAKKRARPAPQEPEPEPEPEQEEADECPICLDALDTTATLVCGHIFHRACIDDWATTQATCPCCRVPLEITN